MLKCFGGVPTLDYAYLHLKTAKDKNFDLDVSKGWPTAKLNSFSWAYFKNNKITHSSVPSKWGGGGGGGGLGQESILNCYTVL